MSFNTVLVQLDVDSAITPRLSFAIGLARKFEADVIAFVAAEAHVFIPRDEGGLVAAEVLRQRTEEIRERFKALKEEYLSLAGESEHVSWRADIGDPTHLTSLHARAADIVVTGKRQPGVPADQNRTIDPGTLILSAGRPVLFTADDLRALEAKRILVAWKDTREARRAVADAMPFLEDAKEVVVTTIAEGDQKEARESAADVVRFLMRHGVNARSDVLGIGDSDVEDAMSQIAREIGADLIVSGGYGHSRLREWAFGGMTRSLLSDGTLHRLISN